MSTECNHDCSSCQQSCGERQAPAKVAPNAGANIKKVIAVVSGKGGVGKSLVTSTLSVLMNRRGHKVGILDADITGPSIPTGFGIKTKAMGTALGIAPAVSAKGVRIMSLNLLLPDTKDPVVWRGPVIGGAVQQFWTDVVWGNVDYLFIDMPPGTGDVPLTVFQSLPVDGIIVVTSPQDLVSMIVEKALKMSAMMNVPVLGLVENMSYFECPSCHDKHYLFGPSHVKELAAEYNIQHTAQIPLDIKTASLFDQGKIEDVTDSPLEVMADALEKELPLTE